MSRPAIPARIARLIPLLGSPVDGEALGTRDAIVKTLASAGLDLHDLAAAIQVAEETSAARSMPNVFEMARAWPDIDCGRLTQPQKKFVGDMCRLGTRQPTERQVEWLAAIYFKLTRKAAA